MSTYVGELSQKLFYAKEDKILDAAGKTEEEKISLSKRLYLQAMQWEAMEFGSIIRNQGFFQHGVIHNIVDDGNFEWKVGGGDEHPKDSKT